MSNIDDSMEIDSGIDMQMMGDMGPSSSMLDHSISQLPQIDENNVFVDDSADLKRFVAKLDQLDDQCEVMRKEALLLQEKRDSFLTELDVLRSSQLLTNLDEYEQEQINCHVQRLNNRIGTIELCVKTVRDSAQEDSLHDINRLIDTLITSPDRTLSRQRCQLFLNCFERTGEDVKSSGTIESDDVDDHAIDRTFHLCLQGCTLDDQKHIRRRLSALNIYLNKQTISN